MQPGNHLVLVTRVSIGDIHRLPTKIHIRIIRPLTLRHRAAMGNLVDFQTLLNHPGYRVMASCLTLSGEVLRPHIKL